MSSRLSDQGITRAMSVVDLPEPWGFIGRAYGLHPESVIAVPLDEDLLVHRLVRNDPPDESDFAEIRPLRAEKQGIPELARTGLSHFLTVEQASEIRWRADQRIGRFVVERNERVYIARTERLSPGHLDIWMPRDVIDVVLGTIGVVA